MKILITFNGLTILGLAIVFFVVGNDSNIIGVLAVWIPIILSVILFFISLNSERWAKTAAFIPLGVLIFIILAAGWSFLGMQLDKRQTRMRNREWNSQVAEKEVELRALPKTFVNPQLPDFILTDSKNTGYYVLIQFGIVPFVDQTMEPAAQRKAILISPVGFRDDKRLIISPSLTDENQKLVRTFRDNEGKSIFEIYKPDATNHLRDEEFETEAYWDKDNNSDRMPNHHHRQYRWKPVISGGQVIRLRINFFNNHRELDYKPKGAKLEDEEFNELDFRKMSVPSSIRLTWKDLKLGRDCKHDIDFKDPNAFADFQNASKDRNNRNENLILPIYLGENCSAYAGRVENVTGEAYQSERRYLEPAILKEIKK